jgi:microcystin-dependent protein
MPTGVTSWSQTAATNASVDSTVNFAEGQTPSSVNDSARAVMASVAKYRDDNAGKLLTGGTSTAYTLTSNQGFASKSAMDGVELSFTVNATNGASPTLNVDSNGGDPITLDGTNAVPTGTMISGSVYTAVYYNSGNTWRLKDFYQLPFTVPIGGVIDYFGTSTPNSNFVFPFGQAISRTTYSALFTLFGTTFGTGDGSTTFNILDLRGRVVAGADNMGGSAASRIGSVVTDSGTIVGATLGSVGGSSTHALTTAELAVHSHANTLTDLGHTHSGVYVSSGFAANTGVTGASSPNYGTGGTSGSNNSTPMSITNANAGSGNAHAIIQPTMIGNKLLRII